MSCGSAWLVAWLLSRQGSGFVGVSSHGDGGSGHTEMARPITPSSAPIAIQVTPVPRWPPFFNLRHAPKRSAGPAHLRAARCRWLTGSWSGGGSL